jgi:hypothetical protein
MAMVLGFKHTAALRCRLSLNGRVLQYRQEDEPVHQNGNNTMAGGQGYLLGGGNTARDISGHVPGLPGTYFSCPNLLS